MGLRAFQLPNDLQVMMDLIPPAFQYPENDNWSIQADEVEDMLDSVQGIRRLWPLLRVFQIVAPNLRDVMRGTIWEEDGRAVGLCNVLRQGETDQWLIGNVAVLPEYRRRGIARELVEGCVDYVRDRGGTVVTLDVIDGNVPAYTLYQRLGFEAYSGKANLSFESAEPVTEVQLPAGYTLEEVGLFTWRPRYELAKRVTPAAVQAYVPVIASRFRQPAPLRLLAPVIGVATGTRHQVFVVRDGHNTVVGYGALRVRTRQGGVNNANLLIDPAHDAALAPWGMRYVTARAQAEAPGRRLEMILPHWQAGLIDAALARGYARLSDLHTMGLQLR